MDCRQFRNKHVAFVDDVLPAVEMRAMHQHRASCPRCSRHDTMIRRSLLLVRNLRPIEPSPDFMVRLNERIAHMGPEAHDDVFPSRPSFASAGAFAALAAGVVAVAYMAMETSHYFAPLNEAHTVAVAATVPALEPTPTLTNAAFVASVPTGIPVGPAMLMASQAPMHFASLDFHDSVLER
jgi:anti-sigma factor RsiW